MNLPERLIKNVIGDLGEQKGNAWLVSLPGVCDVLAQRYGLSSIVPVNNLSWNYVCTAHMRDHGPVVVKVCSVRSIGTNEAVALRAFSAVGCAPKVYAFDEEMCAIIMEQVTSRRMLKSLFPEEDKQAIDITVQLIKKLHTVEHETHAFPHIRSYLASILDGKSTVREQHLADLAQKWSKELLATSPGDILLHGDLHHENVLFDEQRQRWVAIDPLTMVGEPAAEIGSFVRNPVPEISQHKSLKKLLKERIECFSKKMDLPYDRVFKWSYVMAVLGVEWASSTPHSRKAFLSTAQTLFELA